MTDIIRKQPVLAAILLGGFTLGTASAQMMAKAQVANLIANVENGVDQFRDYLKRRKFDAADTWMETKSQVERVVDDGRRINQAVTRGNYGSEAARPWAALRTGINNLARAYGVPPLGV